MKIACDNCNGTIAHVYGDRTIEIVRQGHKMTVTGDDFTIMASCPNTGKCNNKVALVVENGKLILDNLKQKEDKDGEDNKGKETPESSEDGSDQEGDGGEAEEKGGEEGSGNGSEDGGGKDKGDDKGQDAGRKYTKV